jgi:hypothetical protein
MFDDSISFGIDTATGRPYARTCRGTHYFDSPQSVAGFVSARVLARVSNYQAIWESFEDDLDRWHGEKTETEAPF